MITMKFLQYLALISRKFWANETKNVTGLNRIMMVESRRLLPKNYLEEVFSHLC